MFIKNKMKKNSSEHFSMLTVPFKQTGGGGGWEQQVIVSY
jgi:hypothetical protein